MLTGQYFNILEGSVLENNRKIEEVLRKLDEDGFNLKLSSANSQ